MLLTAATAASNPIAYLHRACSALPRLYREGGSAAEAEAATAGVLPALMALQVERGARVDVRIFPRPAGWEISHVPEHGPLVGIHDASELEGGTEARSILPAFRDREDVGMLLVPEGVGWRLWHPVEGSGPAPDRDRVRFKLLVLHGNGQRATFCDFNEMYGEELPHPLYKADAYFVPAKPNDSGGLVEVLSRLMRQPAGGGS